MQAATGTKVTDSVDFVKSKTFKSRKSQPIFGKKRDAQTSKSFRSTVEQRQSLMLKSRGTTMKHDAASTT